MKRIISVEQKEPVVFLGDDYVYGNRRYFCRAANRQLKLSIMRPRNFNDHDIQYEKCPVVMWVCGGGWMEMDRKVWLPELVYLAKQGYAVVSMDYSTEFTTRWPEQMQDVTSAIRWVRTHAAEFAFDPDRIAIMGESAGGHLSVIAGLIEDGLYDSGENPGQSSTVQAVVAWYPPTSPMVLFEELEGTVLRNSVLPDDEALLNSGLSRNMGPADLEKYDDTLKLVKAGAPPFLLLHGDKDSGVAVSHSHKLHDALEQVGNSVELYVIEDADHAEGRFVQPVVKEIILNFLDEHL